tara:strand:- start:2032 stop:2280 length:249 start_codon:yes stop_codon:yes gene_type:complete
MTKFIIYGRSDCPYCIKVITKLAKAKQSFYAEMLDNDPDKLERLKMKYDHPTVPIVIRTEDVEELVGGCDDALELIKKGEKQ